ncbi:MAG: hypothetical protein WHS64_04680 [Fervidobacterium sp.]|uniref:hypothetical protein n=1 Tax=Fervidobacterium sp. TaxID=1871331 RepID=UPI0030A6C49D
MVVRFLGDFSIDYCTDIRLSKSEIITLAYCAVKESFYINQLHEILGDGEYYDTSYIKKILRILSTKISSYVKIELHGNKVISEFKDDCDIKLIVMEVERVEEKFRCGTLTDADVEVLLSIYRGHFLPFLENIWVESYRNTLKSVIFSLLSKLYLSNSISSAMKIKMLRIFPELQMSFVDLKTLKHFSEHIDVSVGDFVFEIGSEDRVLKLKNIKPDMLWKIIRGSNKLFLFGDGEIVLVVSSEVICDLVDVMRK